MSQQEAIIMSLQQQVDRLQGDKKHLEEKVEYLKRVGTTFRSRVISMLERGQTAPSIESVAAVREVPSHSSLAPSDTEQETFFSMVSADTTPAKAQQVHRMLEENQTLTKKVETLKESVSYWRDQATRETRSPSPTSHSHSKGKRGVGLVLRSTSDDQMKALRRKNAALTGKVAQLEENRDREFAIKEEVINSLQSQLSDAKLVATSCEQDALAHQASTSDLKKQNVELSHRCHMLEGQLVTLKKELEIMVNTAQRGAMRQDPSTGREAEVRPLHDSLTELRKTVEELNKKLELESTLRKAAEKRIVALQDEFALMAKMSETQRSTTTNSTADAGGVSNADRLAAVHSRLQSVVGAAEEYVRSSSDHGSVFSMLRRIQLAETIQQTCDRFEAEAIKNKKIVTALLNEITHCQKVGWPFSLYEAEQVLAKERFETTGEANDSLMRESILRTRDGWKEIQDNVTGARYYCTNDVQRTPFASVQ